MRNLMMSLPLAVLLAAAPAQADDDEWAPPVTDPLTLKECGHCHMAFQPAFLPARSWARLMDGLADHFGDDASLGPQQSRHIKEWLMANAGDRVRGGLGRQYTRRLAVDAAPLRITGNPAFLREHRFPEEVWRRPEVVTPSNCPACHRGAERGWYEDARHVPTQSRRKLPLLG